MDDEIPLSDEELRELYGVPQLKPKPNKYSGYCQNCNQWCYVGEGYWEPEPVGLNHRICPKPKRRLTPEERAKIKPFTNKFD